jgi:hypothetical protein
MHDPPPEQGSRHAAAGGEMPAGLPLRALPLYFFLHIPKTAGTSLRHTLAAMFGGFAYIHHEAGDLRRLAEEDPALLDRLLLVGGHMPADNPLARRAARRTVFLSVFREPVARVASLYDHIRRDPGHPLHGELRELSLPRAFEGSERFRVAAVNRQLRMVFGTDDPARIRGALRTRSYVLGRTERLDAFLDAVEAATGLPCPAGTIPRAGTAPERPAAESARAQRGFDAAVALIGAANAAEAAFLEECLPSGVRATAPWAPT